MTSSLRDVEQCNDVMLVLDEIKIVCGVVYNASDDSIVGYAQDMANLDDLFANPDATNSSSTDMTQYIMQSMYRSVVTNFEVLYSHKYFYLLVYSFFYVGTWPLLFTQWSCRYRQSSRIRPRLHNPCFSTRLAPISHYSGRSTIQPRRHPRYDRQAV